MSELNRQTTLAALLLVVFGLMIAFINTVYVGESRIYSREYEDRRRFFHEAVLHNREPPGGWGRHGANGLNTRIGIVYLADFASRLMRIDVLKVYRLIDLASLAVLVPAFALFIARVVGPPLVLPALLYLTAILPLTYEFHAFQPWDKPSWLLWLAAIWACWARRPLLLAASVIVGIVVKYDIVVAPLLYAATWIRRDDMIRPAAEAAAVMAAGFAVLLLLNYAFPGGHSERPILATSLRNATFMLKEHVTYLPTLAFGPLIALALYGWRDGDRFARSALLLAALIGAILFALTNFEEVRAQMMIFLLAAPLALLGFRRATGRG